jgi:DNA mismatch endonuclease (patch repair protein)
MSRVHGKDTKPELLIRKSLHSMGFRYRLYVNSLPGKPDIVFPKYQAIVQFNGCFWHGHNCYLFNWPKTNTDFWYAKISNNIKRDKTNLLKLNQLGWRVLVIWGCSLKGRKRIPIDILINEVSDWLRNGKDNNELMHL